MSKSLAFPSVLKLYFPRFILKNWIEEETIEYLDLRKAAQVFNQSINS